MEIIEKITKLIAAVTAALAVVGGSYTVWDKVSNHLQDKTILIWSPEYFEVSDASASEEFKVVVARQKLRDDCSVEDFQLEVRDSEYIVHVATPSVAKFSGAASNNVEKFGYKFTINEPEKVAKGPATLLAHIYYKCPEGEVLVNYPSHDNLEFVVE